ncbi:Zf-C2H2 type zinc finger protein/UBA domain-containing protein [Schizosaccharomyces pombe]
MVLKCLECDKLLSSIEMAEFHSTKTSHDQFEETEEEIKKRSPEELKQAIEALREKAKEKKEKERILALEEKKTNYKILQKSNDETAQAMRKMQDQARLRDLQKIRQQKAEDAEQRKKILAEIERDKKRRAAERENKNSSVKETAAPIMQPKNANSSSTSTRTPPTSGRFSIRHDGQVCNITIAAEETLRQLAQQVAEKMNVSPPTKFTTTFPRASYGTDVFDKPVNQLDLFPSAVLIPQW